MLRIFRPTYTIDNVNAEAYTAPIKSRGSGSARTVIEETTIHRGKNARTMTGTDRALKS